MSRRKPSVQRALPVAVDVGRASSRATAAVRAFRPRSPSLAYAFCRCRSTVRTDNTSSAAMASLSRSERRGCECRAPAATAGRRAGRSLRHPLCGGPLPSSRSPRAAGLAMQVRRRGRCGYRSPVPPTPGMPVARSRASANSFIRSPRLCRTRVGSSGAAVMPSAVWRHSAAYRTVSARRDSGNWRGFSVGLARTARTPPLSGARSARDPAIRNRRRGPAVVTMVAMMMVCEDCRNSSCPRWPRGVCAGPVVDEPE